MARYLIAGGGTGGHVYPGVAVAEWLRDHGDVEIDFACTRRVMDRQILEACDWRGEIVGQDIEPFSARPVGVVKFCLGQIRSRRLMRKWILEREIQGVLGLGGFGSSAAMAVAHNMGIRSAFLNPDYVPGLANRWLSKYADKIFVQWAESKEFFGREVDVVGVPMRRGILGLANAGEKQKVKADAIVRFGLDSSRKTLVVMGGSTGARSLNGAAHKVVHQMRDRIGEAGWQILHIVGRRDYEQLKNAYDGISFVKVLDYLDEMQLAWGLADAAVCRAGAITVAELAAVGVPSVLLPYPFHKDDHQAKNGGYLAKAGGAVIVEDDKVSGERTVGELRAALEGILFDDDNRGAMAEACGEAGVLTAAEVVGRWLVGEEV